MVQADDLCDDNWSKYGEIIITTGACMAYTACQLFDSFPMFEFKI